MNNAKKIQSSGVLTFLLVYNASMVTAEREDIGLGLNDFHNTLIKPTKPQNPIGQSLLNYDKDLNS